MKAYFLWNWDDMFEASLNIRSTLSYNVVLTKTFNPCMHWIHTVYYTAWFTVHNPLLWTLNNVSSGQKSKIITPQFEKGKDFFFWSHLRLGKFSREKKQGVISPTKIAPPLTLSSRSGISANVPLTSQEERAAGTWKLLEQKGILAHLHLLLHQLLLLFWCWLPWSQSSLLKVGTLLDQVEQLAGTWIPANHLSQWLLQHLQRRIMETITAHIPQHGYYPAESVQGYPIPPPPTPLQAAAPTLEEGVCSSNAVGSSESPICSDCFLHARGEMVAVTWRLPHL